MNWFNRAILATLYTFWYRGGVVVDNGKWAYICHDLDWNPMDGWRVRCYSPNGAIIHAHVVFAQGRLFLRKFPSFNGSTP